MNASDLEYLARAYHVGELALVCDDGSISVGRQLDEPLAWDLAALEFGRDSPEILLRLLRNDQSARTYFRLRNASEPLFYGNSSGLRRTVADVHDLIRALEAQEAAAAAALEALK